ncbi:hypothetical protein GCM10009565_53150 [Amycolatopsis albidoflavus]
MCPSRFTRSMPGWRTAKYRGASAGSAKLSALTTDPAGNASAAARLNPARDAARSRTGCGGTAVPGSRW